MKYILIAMIFLGCADNAEIISIYSKSKDGCECKISIEKPQEMSIKVLK